MTDVVKKERGGPAALREDLLLRRENCLEVLALSSKTDQRTLKHTVLILDAALSELNTQEASGYRNASPAILYEIDRLTDRGRVMARLARKMGRGCDVIYHGTRRLPEVLRSGKLVPPEFGEPAIFLSRSPETAAYFASFLGTTQDQFSPGIMVLNRRSLIQSYRLEPSRYDERSHKDEREEIIRGRLVNFRRHLIGVVRDADVTAILGPPRHKFLPPRYHSWSQARRSKFNQADLSAGDALVQEGRKHVRNIIINSRRRRVLTGSHYSTVLPRQIGGTL